MKIDRNSISITRAKDSESQKIDGYLSLSPGERLEAITLLRESFYGTEATTGRLQRVFEVTQRL